MKQLFRVGHMLHCLCTSLLVGAGVSEGCFVQHVEPAPQLSENERYEKLVALCHTEKREIPFFSPGDLLYLDITTLEGQELYITACPSGFYLNKSTSREVFDPSPRKLAHHSTHLVGLLSQVGSVTSLLTSCFVPGLRNVASLLASCFVPGLRSVAPLLASCFVPGLFLRR